MGEKKTQSAFKTPLFFMDFFKSLRDYVVQIITMQVTIRVTIPGKLGIPWRPSPRWKPNIFEAAKSLFIIKEAFFPSIIIIGQVGQ